MKHGSLFSGIGGFDLAAEWMGWENVFHCEWMEFPRKVLEYYWPNADSHIDICKTDFKKYANRIDILTGGFPCQPFSLAGKRKGTDDERYLWGEMLRAICEIKPQWVIAENVFGITNIDGGLVFEQVCLDLEAQGYEVQPFIIPAAAKNAPHRRDRCWFLAYSDSFGNGKDAKWWVDPIFSGGHGMVIPKKSKGTQAQEYASDTECARLEHGNQTGNIRTKERTSCSKRGKSSNELTTNGNVKRNATDTSNQRLQRSQFFRTPERREWEQNDTRKSATELYKITNWEQFPTQSPVCGGDDGLPTKLDGITFPKWRNESIKGYGNAIVPQIAYQLFQIIEHETKNKTTQEKQQQDIIPSIGD